MSKPPDPFLESCPDEHSAGCTRAGFCSTLGPRSSDITGVFRGRDAYEVAKTKDRDAVIEITNNIAGACDNRHVVYRTYPEKNRCQKQSCQTS
jgi:hypothetical protein